MFKRNWLRWLPFLTLQAAAIILLSRVGIETYQGFLNARNDYDAYRQHEGRQTEEAAKKIAAECSVSHVPPRMIAECVSHQIDTYIQEENPDKDLQAQQDMAYWGQAIFWLSGFGSMISVFGLVALLVSLRQTRTAISDTREIGEAQVRAYVGLVAENDAPVLSDIAAGKTPRVEFNIKNAGNSPARNFRYVAACDVISGRFPETPNDLVRPVHLYGVPTSILHAEEISGGEAKCPRELFADDIKAIFDNEADASFYLFGIVFYDDVFGKPHRTRFCFQLSVSGAEKVREKVAVSTAWHKTVEHNDAD